MASQSDFVKRMKALDNKKKAKLIFLSKPEKNKKGITYVKKNHGKLG